MQIEEVKLPIKSPISFILNQGANHKDLSLEWDLKHFDHANCPWVVGVCYPIECQVPRVLDMPIKLAGSHLFEIPPEFARAVPFIINCHEHATRHYTKKDLGNRYVYLTVDTSDVPPGECQRHEGAHVDGFQGARIDPKVLTDFSYVAVSHCPPDFFRNAFPCKDWDPGKVDFFKGFDRMATEVLTSPSNQIMYMDAYTVHRAGRNTTGRTIRRTFYRLSYSVRQFDRLGNTHNPYLHYKWDMVKRDKPNLPSPEEQP